MIDLNTIIRNARKCNPEVYKDTNGWEYYFPLDYGVFPEYDDFEAMVKFVEDG